MGGENGRSDILPFLGIHDYGRIFWVNLKYEVENNGNSITWPCYPKQAVGGDTVCVWSNAPLAKDGSAILLPPQEGRWCYS